MSITQLVALAAINMLIVLLFVFEKIVEEMVKGMLYMEKDLLSEIALGQCETLMKNYSKGCYKINW